VSFFFFDNISPVLQPIGSNLFSGEVRIEVLCRCKIYVAICTETSKYV